MRCQKGAMWRRWDLHIHTPESHLNNGFGDNFEQYLISDNYFYLPATVKSSG